MLAQDNPRTAMKWILFEAAMVLLSIGIFVAALEMGYRLGQRRQANSDEPDKSHANALHGAVLGLLALLPGFTFAMSVSRYENRKTLMVDQGRRALANLTFACLIAVVLIIILDIDAPRAGVVQVSQDSLLRLQQSMGPAAQ
jgi:hypothetical protein